MTEPRHQSIFYAFCHQKGLTSETAMNGFERFIVSTGYDGPLYTRTWDELDSYLTRWRKSMQQRRAEDETMHYRA